MAGREIFWSQRNYGVGYLRASSSRDYELREAAQPADSNAQYVNKNDVPSLETIIIAQKCSIASEWQTIIVIPKRQKPSHLIDQKHISEAFNLDHFEIPNVPRQRP
ncbi:hypothetical protein IWQ51_006406 [Labrenzia sp. EL_142]|nr:hypothetical protein [Labrenzia sp. EL_142]